LVLYVTTFFGIQAVRSLRLPQGFVFWRVFLRSDSISARAAQLANEVSGPALLFERLV
jgi:hypothetical protein